MKRLLLVNFFTALTFMGFAAHPKARTNCEKALTQEVSAELELVLDERVAEILTTRTGRLVDLFHNAHNVPREIVYYAIQNHLSADRSKVIHMDLEQLPVELRVLAFRQSIVRSGLKFGSSTGGGRRVPHLLIKPRYQEEWKLRPWVDQAAPSTSMDGELIEIHLRHNLRPSEMAKLVRFVRQQLEQDFRANPETDDDAYHIHHPFKEPRDWINENVEIRSLLFVDYWRRLNLVAEMFMVLKEGSVLPFIMTDGVTQFQALGSYSLLEVLSYLSKDGQYLEGGGKMALIGFWGRGKYDQPDLSGFEYRFLRAEKPQSSLLKLLDRVPKVVARREFGNTETRISAWIASLPDEFRAKYMLPRGGHRIEELWSMAVSAFGSPDEAEAQFGRRQRLSYLVHDWSRDPLLFDRPELAQKILDQQIVALNRLQKKEDETLVMQRFIKESGLFEIFAQSVGFKP